MFGYKIRPEDEGNTRSMPRLDDPTDLSRARGIRKRGKRGIQAGEGGARVCRGILIYLIETLSILASPRFSPRVRLRRKLSCPRAAFCIDPQRRSGLSDAAGYDERNISE